MSKPFAIVTGASSGIGLELAAIYGMPGDGGAWFGQEGERVTQRLGRRMLASPAWLAGPVRARRR